MSSALAAQVLNVPNTPNRFGGQVSLTVNQAASMDFDVFRIDTTNPDATPVQSHSAAVSKLDLKSPWKARREYQKGYELLMQKDLQGAVDHLSKSTAIYPKFVAAHNALGTAYMDLGRNEQARDEFALAVSLDDHLPNSYLNLGCAQLNLQQYPAAEESLRKASSIAPLDLQLLTALAYGEFKNSDYAGVLATTRQVHSRKHEGAAVVHYFAAGAFEAQDNLPEARHEIETLLSEDPNSSAAAQFRQILSQLKTEEAIHTEAKLHPAQPVTFDFTTPAQPTSQEAFRQAQQVLQDVKEKNQIAEAEAAPDPACVSCGSTPGANSASNANSRFRPATDSAATFRAAADEVAVFFSATDRGKSVTSLTASEVRIHDDSRDPKGSSTSATNPSFPCVSA